MYDTIVGVQGALQRTVQCRAPGHFNFSSFDRDEYGHMVKLEPKTGSTSTALTRVARKEKEFNRLTVEHVQMLSLV